MYRNCGCTISIHRLVLAAFIVSVLPLVPMSQGFAQDRTLEAIIHRLDRLDLDISGLQKRLANGDGSSLAVPSVQTTDPLYTGLADQEVRLNELAQQLRALTGQIEEAQHSVDLALDEITRFSAEIMDRFEKVENDMAAISNIDSLPPEAINPQEIDSYDVGVRENAAGNGEVTVEQDPNTEQYETMRVLGEISADGELNRFADKDGQSAAPAPPDDEVKSTDPESSYDAAYQLLRRADYAGAERALLNFIEAYPEHELAGNAFYWLGETFYVRNDYDQAAIAFARGYKKFPSGAKAPDNLLKLGISFRGMEKTAEACHTFAKLKLDHTDAPVVILSRLEQERAKAGCQ